MGKDTRHQHYVPQCYIQNFANPKNSKVAKYCFMQNCSFDDKAENICHKRDLYEWDKENSMNQIEKRFSRYELGYSLRLQNFILNCSKIKIEDGKSYKIKNGFQVLDFNLLLKDIIIQMLRVPTVINNLPKIMSESYTAMGIDFSNNKVIQEATEEVKIKALKGVALNTIFKENVDNISSESIEHFYDLICKTHRIVIYKSERLHFFSSCNPLVIDYYGEKRVGDEGFTADYGFENSDFYFSVSPHICIGIEVSDNSGSVYITKVNYTLYESIFTALILQSDYCVYSDKITEKDISFIESILEEKRKSMT